MSTSIEVYVGPYFKAPWIDSKGRVDEGISCEPDCPPSKVNARRERDRKAGFRPLDVLDLEPDFENIIWAPDAGGSSGYIWIPNGSKQGVGRLYTSGSDWEDISVTHELIEAEKAAFVKKYAKVAKAAKDQFSADLKVMWGVLNYWF